MRNRLLLTAATCYSVWAAACGAGSGGSACPTCPSLEGSWAVTFSAGADAGCSAVVGAAGDGKLAITQIGANLRGEYLGATLLGSVYTSADFTLSGTLGADGGQEIDSYTFRGRYQPGDAGADADGGGSSPDAGVKLDGGVDGGTDSGSGDLLTGTLDETHRRVRSGVPPQNCSVTREFTARRQ